MNELKERIENIKWDDYPAPEWNEAGTVSSSLLALASLSDGNAENETYNRVLFALGNNHGGTYYPIVIPAVAFIIEIAEQGRSHVSRKCSLDILIDLISSFDAEIEYEIIPDNVGNRVNLEDVLAVKVYDAKEVFEHIANDSSESSINRQLATDLLECLADIPYHLNNK